MFEKVLYIAFASLNKKKRCPGNFPRGKLPPLSGSGFGLGLALELGLETIFLGGKFLRTEKNAIKYIR